MGHQTFKLNAPSVFGSEALLPRLTTEATDTPQQKYGVRREWH